MNIQYIISLFLFVLVSCVKPETLAKYSAQNENCMIELFDDASYYCICDEEKMQGQWFFESEVDSILCLEEYSSTEGVSRYYVRQNEVFSLEEFESDIGFEWTLGKIGPSWLLSQSQSPVQIISPLDSSLWSLIHKGDNGNIHLLLSGYFFSEEQDGVSAGGSSYKARTFLAIQGNWK